MRPYVALNIWFLATFIRLETAAWPHQGHHGTVVGKGAIGKCDLGAGPLQQRARDEHAEPKAGMIAGMIA